MVVDGRGCNEDGRVDRPGIPEIVDDDVDVSGRGAVDDDGSVIVYA